MDSAKNPTRVAVIMAGGAGERFWPLSRHNRPKQLLKLTSDTRNMLEEAVDRLTPLIPAEHIYIVTGRHLVEAIRKEGVGIAPENVIAEPCKRNTSGCLLYAAAHMLARYGADPSAVSMAVVTADHLIGEPDRFREAVDRALTLAETDDVLVTHGIAPTRPETGYGYIQADLDRPMPGGEPPAHAVAAFHEKPDVEKAAAFLGAGNYYWNSGMFFWRLDAFLNEFRAVRPEMANAAEAMARAMAADDAQEVDRVFESLENVSIDYALMEHARRVAVVRADYPWDDVGAWTSLDRTRERDAAGNVAHGNPVLIDTTDSIVYNDAGEDAVAVSVVGVSGLVVVVSKDGILVTSKEKAQQVRDAVAELKSRNAAQI